MTPNEAIAAIPRNVYVHLGQSVVPQVRLIQTSILLLGDSDEACAIPGDAYAHLGQSVRAHQVRLIQTKHLLFLV